MKKQKWNKVGKKDGFTRGFEFKLLKVKEKGVENTFNAYAKYEVKIGDVVDTYHTTYNNPTAEPEFGRHNDQFNRYYELENDVMTCINQHLWGEVSTNDIGRA